MKDLIRIRILAKPKALKRVYELLSAEYDIIFETEPKKAISPNFRIQHLKLNEREVNADAAEQ